MWTENFWTCSSELSPVKHKRLSAVDMAMFKCHSKPPYNDGLCEVWTENFGTCSTELSSVKHKRLFAVDTVMFKCLFILLSLLNI